MSVHEERAFKMPNPVEVGLDGIDAAIRKQANKVQNLTACEVNVDRLPRKFHIFEKVPVRPSIFACIKGKNSFDWALGTEICYYLDEEELAALKDVNKRRLDALIDMRKRFERETGELMDGEGR